MYGITPWTHKLIPYTLKINITNQTSNNCKINRRCFDNKVRDDTIYECLICLGPPGFCLDCSHIIHQ